MPRNSLEFPSFPSDFSAIPTRLPHDDATTRKLTRSQRKSPSLVRRVEPSNKAHNRTPPSLSLTIELSRMVACCPLVNSELNLIRTPPYTLLMFQQRLLRRIPVSEALYSIFEIPNTHFGEYSTTQTVFVQLPRCSSLGANYDDAQGVSSRSDYPLLSSSVSFFV